MRRDLSSRGSWCAAHLTLMLALPMSPDVENLMPSLVTPISTESPIVDRSLSTERQSFKMMQQDEDVLSAAHSRSYNSKQMAIGKYAIATYFTMRWNSDEGIFTVAWYSVSGMPSLHM